MRGRVPGWAWAVLAGKSYKNLSDPSTSFLLFETAARGKNIVGDRKDALRKSRHGRSVMAGFADGRAQSFPSGFLNGKIEFGSKNNGR